MQEVRRINSGIAPAHLFALGFAACAAIACAAIGTFPIGASIATIFLFAGLHNFFEFRYFIARMPVRWGRSRFYYTFGIGGVLVLTTVYLSIYFGSGTWLWDAEGWQFAVSVWSTALVLWIASLVYLRGRQRPKTDWSWAFAAAFLISAFVWLRPADFAIALVYMHPFVAMWFLERQIRRTRREWLSAYHFCLATIPVFVAILYVLFANSPDLAADTTLFRRIVDHAGNGILTGVSTHFLVATHVFLETIHYAVWIVLMPLVDRRALPWKLSEIPLAANKDGFPRLVYTMLAVSAALVVVVWIGFSFDYSTTRDVYFAFAIAHVLAEMPFLVKML